MSVIDPKVKILSKSNNEKKKKEYLKKIKNSEKSKSNNAFVNLKSLLGNTWAQYYCCIGSAQTGKTYAASKLLLNLKSKLHDNVKCYWLRLSETSVRGLLQDNASKLIDWDLVRKYDLNLKTKNSDVYNLNSQDKLPLCTVLPLSTVYSKKGNAYFDKDFDGEYLIIFDEMNRDTYAGEKVTFDITYNFKRTLENLLRNSGSKQSKAKRVRVIMLGNTMSEASDVLLSFGFIPNPGDFGRYKVRSKKLIIDYLPLTQSYINMRKDSVVDIIQTSNESGFTNIVDADLSLINPKQVNDPVCVVKFYDDKKSWYTIHKNGCIKMYNKETIKNSIAMRRYIQGEDFDRVAVNSIIERFDNQQFTYYNYYTYVSFRHNLMLLKPQK